MDTRMHEHDDGPAAEPPTIERSVEVDAPPGEVWQLVVDDDERSSWFGGPSELEPVPGGAGTFTDPDGGRREAVVEEVTPGCHLRWSWWPEGEDRGGPGTTRVDIHVAPTPAGTRVTVIERPLVADAAATRLESRASAAGALLELEHVVLCRSRVGVG